MINKIIKDLKKDIEELDKEIHKKSPSNCPKCGVRLCSYKAIENHVKKYKHYGNYNKFENITPELTGYFFKRYKITEAKLQTVQMIQKIYNKRVKKLKEELCLGCEGKGCSNCERIDSIMGEEK
ncbi:hypothetical protein KAI04_04260 [Candidatus Pacearchaeota archaeon]|nr:hypothetical protein [Candidatus Pacearchaeota archaeon]